MAPTNEINELDLDDLTEESTDSNSDPQEGPDESASDDVTSDNDTPDVPNDVAPPQPDGELNNPEDGADNPADENDTEFNIPGQIPAGQSQDSEQDTYLHQALLYQVRALNELSAHISNLETNYAGLAGALKAYLASYIGQLETVWQNGQINQSQADSLEQNPTQGTRQVY